MLAVTLAAGCSSEDGGAIVTPTPAPSVANPYLVQRAEGVTELLDDLSRALTGADPAALDALFDPAASDEFRAGLHRVRTNLGGSEPAGDPAEPEARGERLRLRTSGYRLGAEPTAPPQIAAGLQQRLDAAGSSDSWAAPVELRYALGGAATPGIDEAQITDHTVFVVARYRDGWRLAGGAEAVEAVSDDTPGAARPEPWDFGGLVAADVATAGGTSVVLSYPGTDELVTDVAELLPPAVRAVSRFWGTDWPQRAVVVASGQAVEFAGLAGTPTDFGSAAAATVYRSLDLRARTVTGQRLLLAPGAGDLAKPALAILLRHEMFHIASRLDTGLAAPLWLTEGVAEYVGRLGTYRRLADAAPQLAGQVADGDLPEALPADADFDVTESKSTLAYQQAWSMAVFIADRYGEAAQRRLYPGVAATADRAAQDAVIDEVLGVDRDGLIADWQDWLREQVD